MRIWTYLFVLTPSAVASPPHLLLEGSPNLLAPLKRGRAVCISFAMHRTILVGSSRREGVATICSANVICREICFCPKLVRKKLVTEKKVVYLQKNYHCNMARKIYPNPIIDVMEARVEKGFASSKQKNKKDAKHVATLRKFPFESLYAKGLIFHNKYTQAVPNAIRIDDETIPGSSPIYRKTKDEVCLVYTPASEIFAPMDSRKLFHKSTLEYIEFCTGFNTLKVTDMSEMFSHCEKLTKLDLSSFNTSNVTNMSSMFVDCGNLTSLDLSSFNTATVTDMSKMFFLRKKLTSLDLSSFSSNSLCAFDEAFFECSSLKLIIFANGFSLRQNGHISEVFGMVQRKNLGMVQSEPHPITIKCSRQTKKWLMQEKNIRTADI